MTMAIVIGDDTLDVPTDKPIVPIESVDYIPGFVENDMKRVPVGDFETSDHTHDGEVITPERVDFPGGESELYLGVDGGDGPYVWIANPGRKVYLKGNSIQLLPNNFCRIDRYLQVQTDGSVDPCLRIDGTNGSRNAIADSWTTFPCTEASKEDIVEISDEVLQRLDGMRGITFTQDGVDGVGVSVEDLDKLRLPGLVWRDSKGAAIAIDKTTLIPVLLQAIKRLRAQARHRFLRINHLEKRIKDLEEKVL